MVELIDPASFWERPRRSDGKVLSGSLLKEEEFVDKFGPEALDDLKQYCQVSARRNTTAGTTRDEEGELRSLCSKLNQVLGIPIESFLAGKDGAQVED